ncbi:MFS transporter [Aminobacter niigataensis]|uniref:MFS transporter n=1 Tax=Aminobacter niigataensis TaxID=83265 RepID=UPI0024C522C0|nr:MFS transporter [Aminobacter niigataensis]CAI2934484.1 Phosphoglycerate transporter family protein [Aminobacter niigataensis]
MTYIAFVRDNPRWLAGGFLLTFFSTFGMTSFVALSAGDIRRDYGLSHGEFGTLYMFATLASALSLPYLGQIVDRHSVRNVALFIVPMLALASASMALSQHLVILFVAIYLLRLFGQGMMVHAAYTATARWFSAQRGRALSTVILGHNAGDAFLPMGFVLISAAVGWRNGWLLSAAVLALVAVPAVAFLVATDRKPRSSDPVARRVDARDWTRAEVVRDPIFYVLLLGVMAPGLIVTTLFFHQVYLVELRGWSLEVFASSYLVTAVVNTAFTLVVGQLIDRFSGVSLLPFVLLPLGFACLFLGLVEAQWSAFGFMALLGVSNGLSTTLFGAVWPEVYGLKHLGSIRALIVAAGVLASAIGPGLTGFLIDGGVSYPGQILAMGFYCFAVSFVLLLASRRVRARSHVQAAPAAASV